MTKVLVALLLLACLVAITSAYWSGNCSYRRCNPWIPYPYPQCDYHEYCTQYGFCCSLYGRGHGHY